jgi:Holliday junction resolvasome RuvABC endonuclease subunit
MNQARKYALTMSLYTNSRGFAFVLFEGTLSPYDWRIVDVRGPKKDGQCLNKITAIFDRTEPDVLILQDTGPGGTRRAARLVALNNAVEAAAYQRSIPVFKYSRGEVYRCFASTGFANKQALAELIAKHIPAFERYVPPPRKPWKSEDARMGIFDAAALALVFFQKAGTEQP